MSSQWVVQGRCVRHTSGLVVRIDSGSFSDPYEITIMDKPKVDCIKLAELIREGLAFAAKAKSPAVEIS